MDEQKIRRAIEHFEAIGGEEIPGVPREYLLMNEVGIFKEILKFEDAEHLMHLVPYKNNYDQHLRAVELLWGITERESDTYSWLWAIDEIVPTGKNIANNLRKFLKEIKTELEGEAMYG